MYSYQPVFYEIRPELIVQRKPVRKIELLLQVDPTMEYQYVPAHDEKRELENQIQELQEEIALLRRASKTKIEPIVMNTNNAVRNGILIMVLLIVSVISTLVVSSVI